MTECWLYIYEHRERRSVYIGIADSMDRVFEAHNPDAEELRDAPGTAILQTLQPFSSRQDARKAEAIAIHIATLSGIAVRAENDHGESVNFTNRAGIVSTGELGPAIFVRQGSVDFSTFKTTVFVPITPGSVDDRVAPFGGRGGAVFADRVSKYWNIGRDKRSRITRAVAVLTGGRSLILGDWDVDPAGSWSPATTVGSRVEIPLVDPSDDDPRGIKGKMLTSHRSQPGVTYSVDLRT